MKGRDHGNSTPKGKTAETYPFNPRGSLQLVYISLIIVYFRSMICGYLFDRWLPKFNTRLL